MHQGESVSFRVHARILVLAILTACRTPNSASIRDEDLVREVEQRADEPEVLARALELAGLDELPTPWLDGWREGPERDAYWYALALVWNPECQTARARLIGARARSSASGRPAPTGAVLEIEDLSAPGESSDLGVLVDLLSIFGLGPRAAAALLTTVEARSAQADLEVAIWSARNNVDRARVELAAAGDRNDALAALRAEIESDLTRIGLLEEAGWLARREVELARSAVATLDLELARARSRETLARRALGLVTGLPPGAPALEVAARARLARFRDPSSPAVDPTPLALLGGVPELRAARMQYALAEARVRFAASERWPRLRLGPRFAFRTAGDVLGGIAELEIPWPGAADGMVSTALAERGLARARLENGLAASRTALRTAAERWRVIREALGGAEPRLEASSAAVWRAARARFAVDPQVLMEWRDALDRRREAVLAAVDLQEEERLLAIEWRGAAGAGAEVRP